MALNDGLIRYFKFEETSDSVLTDQMGNANGSHIGTYSVNQTGKIGKSVLYTSGYTALGSLGAGYQSSSCSFWFKVNRFNSGHVDQIVNLAYSNFYWRLFTHDYVSPTNALFFDVYGGSGYNAGFTPTTGNWYHIVVTSGTGGTKLYINGSLVNTQTPSSGQSWTSNGAIGSGYSSPSFNTEYSNVNVDEMGIWNRELTSTEVTTLYGSGSGYEIPLVTGSSNFFQLF